MVLGLLAAGAVIGEEIARGIITRDKNNDLSWDPNAGGYSGAKSLESRVSQYITAGGRPEYQNATEHPKTFSIYNNPYSKQATGYNTFEYYKAPDGTYTRDLTKIANISMDENGKITVTVPDKWENDEQVASYVDSAMLKKLSGNYKMNKDVEYQDPYDESKKVKTQEYLDKINEALKFRVNVLDSLYPMKTAIISMFGGTEDKNKVANGIDTDDVIIMSLKYEDDDSWVPLPAYMTEAYPQLKELSTFNNGYVQKKDFLENFYNIEGAKITEANAYGISRTPGMMLTEIEDMTHGEVAKTVAFGNFIATVDPKRSNWQQFSQAVEGLSKGFYAGLYDWFIGESDLIANIANFSLVTGNSVETRDFWNGLLGVDVSEETKKRMQVMAYTNKDAFSKAQAGYAQGRLAGQAIDTVVSMIAIGEATKAISTKITSAITEKGAENVAVKMAEGTDASTATGMATEAQAREAFLADVAKQNAAISKVATGGAKYQAFFAQTWDDALSLYYKVLGGTTAALQSMGPAQLASAVNAASKIATAASWANTAVNVLGSMTIAAVVGNKELTTKVLSGKATSDEAKSLILQTAWTVAKYGALFKVGNFIGGQAYKDFQGTKLEEAIKQFSQKASQKMTKFGSKITHPWLTFMKWYVNKQAVANKVSNAKLAKTEALKEAILADEMRAYGANLSTEPGSYGISAIEDALAASGTQRGATMAETLQNLERAGISFDPASLSLSSYEAWQADYVNAQNKITAWGDVEGNVSIVIHEFTNPDIEPVISQQMTEINKANSDLLNAEKEAGLLSKKEISANKKLMKEDEGYLYAFHSPELARYIVRNYELRVITREALKDGVADLSSYTPYVEAKGRLEAAANAVPQNIREIADTRYVPALQKAEHEIIDRMIDPKWAVYPRAFVEAMRSSGKYGTNGDDWMRLVARKEVPTGAYNPFSKQAKQDNTIALGGFKVLDDADITWPGNGLTELITEFGIARTEKAFVEASKKATGLTTQVEVSGAKTAGAGKMKEFRTDFQKAIRKGFKAFTSEVEGTTAIGKKRALEQKEFFNEVAVTGGVSTIDIDSLRAVMREKGVILSESIVDQESLDKFLAESSPEARKLIIDVTGEKPTVIDRDKAMSSNEVKRYEQTIKDMENEIVARSPKENANEFIPTLSYQQRKELAQRVAEQDYGEYVLLYRMQGGAPDKWRPNNRGKKGKFEGRVGELKGAVWLTSDPDWVEGPERATAGVKSSFTDGVEVTDENIVVIPVKKSDILDNTYDGGEEYKDDKVLRGKIKKSGKKIIQTRATEISEVVDQAQERGISPRYLDHSRPDVAKKTEFILFEQDHPEVLSDGMELMLQEYNKQFDNRYNKRAIDRIQRDIDYSKGEGFEMVLREYLRTAQYQSLRDLGDSNSTEYDTLMNKVDRANALASPEVKSSNEVSVAAEEYRSNIKEFEDTSIFTEKFSYLTKLSAPKGSLKEFAETNGLTLPDGKQSISAKVKHALWEKLQNGEELPRIKGIKKSDISKDMDKKEFYKMLDNTELFKNPSGSNALKYDLDSEKIYTDIDDAINTMLDMVKTDPAAKAAIEGLMQYQDYWYTAARYDFTVLSEVLSKENADELERRVDAIAATVMKSAIPKNAVIIEGNRDQLFKKIKTAVQDKLESRFAQAKTQLESIGEKVESETITELLQKYTEEIHAAEDNDLVIKTTDKNGEIQYERVSPSIAAIYNERPIYTPISTPVQILADLALLKKINTTDINPRSFSKQAVSDPVMAFATVGAMPGTLQAMRSEIAAQFGPDILQALQKTDPIRYQSIQLIAQREGISEEQALSRNLKAISSTQVPFTLLNRELLHQANVAKYGNKAAIEMRRKNIAEKLNGALTKVSGKLGFLQDKRETYNRLLAGEKAYINALRKGYNPTQAEYFREYAINTATTNFRLKHTMFNGLRITVPYLTSNISGAKSFWKMFELDPVGVSARIFTGFILPIMYFLGEIFSDENMRKKYEQLAESEKENHIVIAIGGELIPIPVGEEIGQYLNVVTHLVETLYGENQYSFWTLMLNDMVGLLPGADLTGFTDPEILEPLSRETPNFLEVMENGIAKVLASTAPPVLQSVYMYNTGRDLYTGKYIDNSYVTIDEDGNPQIMTYTTSQFAKFLANVVGGDARVIEKVTSGLAGTTFLHLLDTLVSAGQFVATGGKEGSLTTAIDKALEDIAKPYSTYGYHALDKRLNAAINSLYRQKDEIVHGDPSHNLYMKYNQEISKESDPKKRQELKNKRDQLLTGFLNSVQKLVEGYRDAGGTLDKWKFSKIVSLITFEDAVRADRQYMELFTSYNDAYKQAMQTLYDMGIQNPEGPSSLGYIYTDKDGNPQLKMWTPAQIQIMQNAFYQQNNIYAAQIEGIIDDGSDNSLRKQMSQLMDDEQKYWNKPKMTSADYDAIDEMRKTFNEKVVKALSDYMDTYGAANVLSNDAVIDYLNDIIRVPTAYEKIKGRNISSDNGKLNKQTGFAESYIKKIFKVEGVKK